VARAVAVRTLAVLPFFDRPWLLALAVMLPAAVILALRAGYRRRLARLARLGSADLVRRLVPAAALVRPAGRAARLGLAAALGAIAMAGPRWGAEPTLVRGSGVDVVLVLDASLSMLAQDERPSRLERMKQEVRRLRATSRGDRIALLAFAGRSYILTPLTVDDGALDLFLDNFDPSVVGQPGTSLSRPIAQAVDLLKATAAESDRAVVVFSDGEAHEPTEAIVEAARQTRAARIAFVAVGFGTTEGTTIPVREEGTVRPHRDADGNIVVTRYRPEVLRAAAEAAGGTFIDAAETDKAGRVRAALSTLRATTRAAAAGRDRTPRFQLFVLPALALLLLDTALAERRGRRRRGAAASVVTGTSDAGTSDTGTSDTGTSDRRRIGAGRS